METSLVTGGAGFLGSWLCEDLLKKEHKVICIDNLITGRTSNIQNFRKNKNFLFFKHDIEKPIEVKGNIDYIFHFASPASPKDFTRIPIEIMAVNSIGTINTLNLSREKEAKLILASSSEIYGDPKEHPQKETYYGNVSSIGPRSCYDESKRFAEAIVMSYYRLYNLDSVIMRIFNTYGPRMRKDDGRVIPSFISNSLKNKPLTIFGDGNQTRSFCYVTDLISGIEKIAFSKYSGEVFNLGNPDEKRIREVAEIVLRLTGSKSKVLYKKAMPDDPIKRKPDIGKVKKMIGWEPRINFEEGLKEIVEWFKYRT